MEEQPINSKKGSPIAVVATTIVVVLVVIGIMGLVANSNSPTSNSAINTQPSQSNQVVQPAPVQVQAANVALKSKCATDGASFVRTYEQQNGSQGTVWQTPEFHYSAQLSTCLVYIGYVYQIDQSPIDLSSPNYWADLIVYNFIFDIYSNQTLLQNVANRRNNNGQNTDTLSQYPSYPDVANVDWSTFNQKMQVLMSG